MTNTTDTKSWREFEAVPMALHAVQVEELSRDCPWPLGYDLRRHPCVELPGRGSVPIEAGDWLVELVPGRIEVMPDGMFRAMVSHEKAPWNPDVVLDASQGKGSTRTLDEALAAADAQDAARRDTIPAAPGALVVVPRFPNGEPIGAADFAREHESRSGIEHASGASTLNEPP